MAQLCKDQAVDDPEPTIVVLSAVKGINAIIMQVKMT